MQKSMREMISQISGDTGREGIDAGGRRDKKFREYNCREYNHKRRNRKKRKYHLETM